MQGRIDEAVRGVLAAGNGAYVVVPLSGGAALKVTYLWGKLGIVFCDVEGKITSPARRGRGSRITTTTETEVGEGAAMPPPPVHVALGDEFLPLAEDSYDDPD